MGKKRAMAATTTTTTTPVFQFTAAADGTEPPHHFSDYGFDPQLLCFAQLPETKRARRHHQKQQQPPLEHERFKLHKPISKKHQRTQKHGDKQRRRWWSSVASAALQLFFKRPAARTAGVASSSSCSRAAFAPPTGPLYFADDGGDDSTGCTCWSPAVRSGSGHLTAAELGIASVAVPYASLRDVSLGGGVGGTGGAAPSMPIYLVT